MLEAPEKTYARKSRGPRGVAAASAAGSATAATPHRAASPPLLRRGLPDDFARSESEEEEIFRRTRARRLRGLRFRVRAVPESLAGRIAAGVAVAAMLVGTAAAVWGARTMLLADPRLVIPSSSAIQISGNNHLTRAQLLSVFGEDVDRNLLTISLAERRAQLEQLPWVQHATVMRLLPNRIRVAITERTPVAFLRQGGQVGLVDSEGVLLDMVSDAEAPVPTHYSFPVVTGITASEPASTRAARMKLYEDFVHQLDAGKDKVSSTLSEVDVTSPEDVKALIPGGSSEILVHFGTENFFARYQRFEQRLPEWRQQYPRLASADMRYERQVVLEMAPGAPVPAPADVAAAAAGEKDQAKAQKMMSRRNKTDVRPAPKSAARAAQKAAVGISAKRAKATPQKAVLKSAAKSAAKPAAKGSPSAKTQTPGGASPHLEKSFDAPSGTHSRTSQAAPR